MKTPTHRSAAAQLSLAALLMAAYLPHAAWAEAPKATPPAADQAQSPAAKPEGPPAKRPAVPSRAELLDGLYGQLAKAPNAETAATIVAALEEVWAQSGSPTVDVLMQRAMVAAHEKRTALAMRLLDAVVELKPDSSEAFARRAIMHVMQDNRTQALGDLRRALALDPNNFRALEGLWQVLRDIGEKKASLEALRQLLKVHPHAEGAREAFEELKREVEGQGI